MERIVDTGGGEPGASRPLVLHPFLFALYPVLYVYAANVGEARPYQVLVPAAVLLGLVCVLMLGALALYRDAHRAGLVSSALLLLFSFYGHVSRPLGQYHVMGMTPFRHRVLVPLAVLAIVFLAFALLRRRGAWFPLTSCLNGVAAALVALALVQAGWKHLTLPAPPSAAHTGDIAVTAPVREKPDIYLIIADEFARADVLEETFGLDDSAFLDRLRGMGFVVASRSVSNYSRTTPSVASFMNLDYLPGVEPDDSLGPEDDVEWIGMIRQNRLMEFLRRQGYRVVSYISSFSATEGMENLDLEIDATPNLNEFSGLLIRGSFLSFLQDVLGMARLDPDRANRARVDYILEDVRTRTAPAGAPTFTFVHVPAPHPPFVVHADGSPILRSEKERLGFRGDFWASPPEAQAKLYRTFYPEQVQYVARRLEEVAQALLERPGPKPIILILSDHGSWESWVKLPIRERLEPTPAVARERFPNLVALHMPGVEQSDLDDLSLVNVTRLVLREALHADLPPLPDRCYFVGSHLRDVTDQARRREKAEK